MKFLTKKPVVFLILLLVGYSQVFLHLHRVDFAPAIKEKRSHQIEVPAARSIQIGGNYFDADNKKNSLKALLGNTLGADLFYGHVSAEFFFQRVATRSSFQDSFSDIPLSGTSLFRVLRL